MARRWPKAEPGEPFREFGARLEERARTERTTSKIVRARPEEALRLDLVGPWAGCERAAEELPEAPSHWHVTGFLVPNEAPTEQKEDPSRPEFLRIRGLERGVHRRLMADPLVQESPSGGISRKSDYRHLIDGRWPRTRVPP